MLELMMRGKVGRHRRECISSLGGSWQGASALGPRACKISRTCPTRKAKDGGPSMCVSHDSRVELLTPCCFLHETFVRRRRCWERRGRGWERKGCSLLPMRLLEPNASRAFLLIRLNSLITQRASQSFACKSMIAHEFSAKAVGFVRANMRHELTPRGQSSVLACRKWSFLQRPQLCS